MIRTRRFVFVVSFMALLSLAFYHAPGRPTINLALSATDTHWKRKTGVGTSTSWCTQTRRLEVLERECQRLNRTFGDYQDQANILVDDRHKLLFCLPRKGGSSSWFRLLFRASGKLQQGRELKNVHSPQFLEKYGITHLNSYDRDNVVKRLESYYKFIVVRHPIERVVSAWYDKFIMPDGPFKELGKRVVARYKSNRTERQKNLEPEFWNDKPFFVEFARHLRERHHDNEHWQSIDSFCSPCALKWDAIIKVESSSNDNGLVLTHLRDDINVTSLPMDHANQKQDEINHFSKKLEDMRDIRPEVLRFLHEIYDNDLAMFGYHWDQENLIATCGLPNSDDTCC